MNTPLTDAEEFQREGSAMWVVKAGFARQLERELSASQEKVRELREALAHILGEKDMENVGWRGRNPPRNDHFSCEFCAKSHLDCTLIEHQEDCPVTIARAILEKTK